VHCTSHSVTVRSQARRASWGQGFRSPSRHVPMCRPERYKADAPSKKFCRVSERSLVSNLILDLNRLDYKCSMQPAAVQQWLMCLQCPVAHVPAVSSGSCACSVQWLMCLQCPVAHVPTVSSGSCAYSVQWLMCLQCPRGAWN